MRGMVIGLGVVLIAALGWVGYVEWKAVAITRVPFRVETTDGDFAVRRYPALVLASVEAAGTREAALDAALPTLRAFIEGGNASDTVIDTTRPMLQAPVDAAATPGAPLAEADDFAEDEWIVSFVMPNWFTAATLPQPGAAAITISSEFSARVAVVSFSGFAGEEDLRSETADLLAFMAEQGLTAAGPPRYAIYDPPWRLPFLRHHEVQIPVAEANPGA